MASLFSVVNTKRLYPFSLLHSLHACFSPIHPVRQILHKYQKPGDYLLGLPSHGRWNVVFTSVFACWTVAVCHKVPASSHFTVEKSAVKSCFSSDTCVRNLYSSDLPHQTFLSEFSGGRLHTHIATSPALWLDGGFLPSREYSFLSVGQRACVCVRKQTHTLFWEDAEALCIWLQPNGFSMYTLSTYVKLLGAA